MSAAILARRIERAARQIEKQRRVLQAPFAMPADIPRPRGMGRREYYSHLRVLIRNERVLAECASQLLGLPLLPESPALRAAMRPSESV